MNTIGLYYPLISLRVKKNANDKNFTYIYDNIIICKLLVHTYLQKPANCKTQIKIRQQRREKDLVKIYNANGSQ